MENLDGFHSTAENLNGFHSTAVYPDDRSSLNIPLPRTSYPVTQQFRSGSSSSMISDAVPPPAAVDVPRLEACMEEEDVAKALRDKIASHPLYPKLLYAYIDCQKVGAPPQTAKLLDEIGRESTNLWQRSACSSDDPELDDFMEMYCDLLVKFKSDLSKPFNEAMVFLSNMELQLNSLCDEPTIEAARSWEEDFISNSNKEKEASELKRMNEDRELKDKLLRRYAGYISSLKHEFSKQKKKEKLPKEATDILLAWWNIHFEWPYPTEADKVELAEWTGLDQKQINNWFINQRKRHWKPTEEIMQTAVLDGLYGPFIIDND